MSFIPEGTQTVEIPSVNDGQPHNPLLGDNERDPSEEQKIVLKYELLKCDQRCLVTGTVSTQLQACHLVNAIRTGNPGQKKKERKGKKEKKEDLEKRVESILTRQQFGPGAFSLDSLPNLVAIEAQWHGDLDTWGSFCIVISLLQVKAIIETLRKSNIDWEDRAKSDPQAPRNLKIKEDPFVVKKCVLLVLRPSLFLPENRPLLINTRRVLRKPGGPPLTETEGPLWTQYYLQDGSPYLIDASGQELTEFDHITNRDPDQGLSIFSMLVNAHSKLQGVKRRTEERARRRVKELAEQLAEQLGGQPAGQPTEQPAEQPAEQLSSYPTDVKEYIDCVEEVAKAIFFVPCGLQKKASPVPQEKKTSLPVPPAPSRSSGQRPHPAPGPSARSRGGRGSKGQRQRRGRKDDSAVEKERSDLDVELEDSDYCSGKNWEDDESDTINGLTFSQMETVLQRVSDGAIPDQERVEAAMLMLGMGGPQGLPPLIEGRA